MSGRVGTLDVSGAHAHFASKRGGVPGAHIWVLAALALGFLCAPIYGQQGGQTSSTPPLTGAVAPTGSCGVGSLYVNTTTGDLYDCNAGSWNKVNGAGGSGAFSGGLGTSYQDAGGISAPANPASGNARLFFNSGTSLLSCLTSTGASCMPAGGAGTVTQVTSGNFSPLFNVSVATNTTTPAFSFAGISQSQNLFFASPNGSSGVGAFRAVAAPDLPASANSCATHQFTISLASGLTVTCAQPVAADIGSIPGSSGQLLYNNAGAIGAEDPIVSYAYINLFTGASATGTQTSSVTRDSTFGQYGTLIVTWASITGSPSGCTIQIKSADSQGNLVNNGSAVSVSPANGTSGINFTPASSLQTASQMQAVYACSTYPSAGTLTLDFAPAITTYATQGPQGQQSSPWWVRPTDGTNNMPMGDAAARKIFIQPTDGANNISYADPCVNGSRTPVSINQTANTKLVSGVSAKKIYVCSFKWITASAQNVALVEGTGTTCATSTAGLLGFGGSSAATGDNLAANGGIVLSGGGYSLGQENTAADDLCLFQSGTGQVSGGLVYVQQ